ncbi:hypothetical protein pb186bvf_011549 [Paramecium bursaria]
MKYDQDQMYQNLIFLLKPQFEVIWNIQNQSHKIFKCNLFQYLSILMNQEQNNEAHDIILKKVKIILNPKELDILKKLIKASTRIKDQTIFKQRGGMWDENYDSEKQIWTQKQEQYRNFLRKVPNFFLAMFKKWLRQEGFDFEYNFIEKIRNQKKSRQHRFELCDLKICFIQEHMIDDKLIDLKPLFIEFLTKQAKIKIINNNKASYNNKWKYIEHIDQLLQELKKEEPFKNYYKSVPQKKEESNYKEDDSIQQLTKQTHIEQSSSYQQQSFYDPFEFNLEE